MDPILQMFLSWQFIVFSLAVAAIMFVVRTTAEYILKNYQPAAKESKIWNDLLLPILPVFIGGLFAFFSKNYPYPNDLSANSSRVVFGVVAGLMSGLMYRVIKSLLSQKISAITETTTQNTTDSSNTNS